MTGSHFPTSKQQQIGSSKIFCCLDLRAGYYQIPLDESSKEKTAFTSPEGHREFNSLPFGVQSAPGAFQRVVNTVLTRLIGSSAHVYLDYIITDHFSNLEQVLSRLQKAKLKVKLEKCDFSRRKLLTWDILLLAQRD